MIVVSCFEASSLTIAILEFWSQKWSYLDKRVELPLTLALGASLVNTVHLQSMANCDNANTNANFC